MRLKITKCEKLSGVVNISGSKNTALPIIAACLITKKKIILKNIPLITDVLLMIDIIKSMGVYVKREKHKLIIKAKSFNPIIESIDVTKFRASYYLIGACLARYNVCSIRLPGGCNFSDRPINMHIKAFEDLGYVIDEYNDTLYIKKEKDSKNKICFTKKSVGTTINTLIACTNSNHPINLVNVSVEPEVLETIKFLKKIGVTIINTNKSIYIFTSNLKYSTSYKIISDRIETGSYMLLAAAIPNSHLIIKNSPIKYMESVINVIRDLGCIVNIHDETIIVKSGNIKSIKLEINEYPSFPTDLQPILSTVLLCANKRSIVKDYIYPDRISHVEELRKMKAKIQQMNNSIIINKSSLIGSNVRAKDLRMAFSLIIAGSIASGETTVENAKILLRGYEQPIIKLKKIGIQITEFIS